MLFQLLNGIVKGHHILMNVTGQPQDLLFAVQNFNALCVWVVAGSEWARNGGCIGPVGGHEEGGGGGSGEGCVYREAGLSNKHLLLSMSSMRCRERMTLSSLWHP